MKLDKEVQDLMKQLADAEKELEKKKDDAMQDMMMADMVRPHQSSFTHRVIFSAIDWSSDLYLYQL